MNLDYKICTILKKNEVKKMREILDSSENWKDGIKSTYGITKSVKNNEENWFDEKVDEIKDFIGKRYLNSEYTHRLTNIESITTPIISQTIEGGYYKPHIDRPESGQFSTTLFLSEPDEYEGGELILSLSGSLKKVKLSAGKAIIYKSGTPHCVNEVTSGRRVVSIGWIKSMITDRCDREVLYMLRELKEKLKEKYPDFDEEKRVWESLSEAESDPIFIYKNIKHHIQSKYVVDLENSIRIEG